MPTDLLPVLFFEILVCADARRNEIVGRTATNELRAYVLLRIFPDDSRDEAERLTLERFEKDAPSLATYAKECFDSIRARREVGRFTTSTVQRPDRGTP